MSFEVVLTMHWFWKELGEEFLVSSAVRVLLVSVESQSLTIADRVFRRSLGNLWQKYSGHYYLFWVALSNTGNSGHDWTLKKLDI